MLIDGMHGLGDSIHQRAVVRHIMEKENVFLRTPWPTVYHDMVGDRLTLIRPDSKLRTQQKNIVRQASLYGDSRQASSHRSKKIWYTPDECKRHGGILAGMCANAGVPKGDFSLPVLPEWVEAARGAIGPQEKPILLYRPLVDRKEWDGCNQRNPDIKAYSELLMSIRDDFYVVSIADTEVGKEWIVSGDIYADKEFHKGELPFETIAGLASISGMVYCSAGFMLILAQAVNSPMVAVFGGRESSKMYNHGMRNNLFIDPVNACDCFAKYHNCDKRIDMGDAKERLRGFVNAQK